jgi:hypothetical protein
MKKTYIKILFILAFCVFSLNFANAATISPDKYFKNANSGLDITDKLTIYSDPSMKGTVKLYLSVNSMVKVGDGDDREFNLPKPENLAEIANYITLDRNEIELKPSGAEIINWTYKPNSNVGCGTNMAAIIISTSPGNTPLQGGKVELGYSIASQIHININLKDGVKCNNGCKIEIIDFKLDSTFPIFNFDGEKFITVVRNSGNEILRGPDGFIDITGFGGKDNVQLNPTYLDIYPFTSRKFLNEFIDEDYPKNDNFIVQMWYEITHIKIGKYDARLAITRSVDRPIYSNTVSFWIIPWKWVILLFIVIVLTIILVRRKIKSKRK